MVTNQFHVYFFTRWVKYSSIITWHVSGVNINPPKCFYYVLLVWILLWQTVVSTHNRKVPDPLGPGGFSKWILYVLSVTEGTPWVWMIAHLCDVALQWACNMSRVFPLSRSKAAERAISSLPLKTDKYCRTSVVSQQRRLVNSVWQQKCSSFFLLFF